MSARHAAVPRDPVHRDPVPRVAVVGVHGHGAAHVIAVRDLERRGLARLVGLVDPVAGVIERDGHRLDPSELPALDPDLDALLDRAEVDVVIVATPLHSHAELTERALEAGADVLLEKPPVTALADLDRLIRAQERTGGLVQVGFQSLGSHAVRALAAAMAEGELGEILSITAHGSWTRDTAYWTRSRWAGRRELDGVRVVDGVLANPFAHALMTSLRLAGWSRADEIDRIELDLRRVNPIETDDTSSFRLGSSSAAFRGPVAGAFTLAGPREDEPVIRVAGSLGVAELAYTTDTLRMPGAAPVVHGRDDLLADLIAARVGRGTGDGSADGALIAPLASCGAFVRVIEAIAAEPVTPIADEHVEWVGGGTRRRPVLAAAAEAVDRAAERGLLFRELSGVAWA